MSQKRETAWNICLAKKHFSLVKFTPVSVRFWWQTNWHKKYLFNIKNLSLKLYQGKPIYKFDGKQIVKKLWEYMKYIDEKIMDPLNFLVIKIKNKMVIPVNIFFVVFKRYLTKNLIRNVKIYYCMKQSQIKMKRQLFKRKLNDEQILFSL